MGDNQNVLKEYLVLLMKKRLDTNELSREYDELEGNFLRVDLNFSLNSCNRSSRGYMLIWDISIIFSDTPPAHDHYLQHKAMIQEELCQKAENNRLKNRYCNLFPFDRNLVQLEECLNYI